MRCVAATGKSSVCSNRRALVERNVDAFHAIRGLLGAQFGVDVDLLLPLRRSREDTGKLGDGIGEFRRNRAHFEDDSSGLGRRKHAAVVEVDGTNSRIICQRRNNHIRISHEVRN